MFIFCRIQRRFWKPVVAAFLLAATGCGHAKSPNYQHDVEIAPEKWLTLKEERGKCWFICEWKGKQVVWDGKRDRYDETELPVTLREFEGNLYLIVLNRENMEELKFVYSKLDDAGTRFTKIPKHEFPKRIATQNMQLSSRTRMVGVGDERVDSWEVIRKLDADHPYFYLHSLTAAIWIELETGMVFAKTRQMGNPEFKQRTVREYKAKHQPIPLPTLVKE